MLRDWSALDKFTRDIDPARNERSVWDEVARLRVGCDVPEENPTYCSDEYADMLDEMRNAAREREGPLY